ncbi:unnamed protein product [Calypogeia fissa]
MDWIMKTFRSLQSKIEACEKASCSDVSSIFQLPGQCLNDSVYQVCKSSGRPSVEIFSSTVSIWMEAWMDT